MVTPYAPYRDGIAAYSVQEVVQRNKNGEQIEVVSPVPSAAHYHLNLGSFKGATDLVKKARRYDKVIVQFYPELLFGKCSGRIERYLVWKSLRILCSVTSVEFRIHEINYGVFEKNFIERRAAKKALKSAETVFAHTQAETIELTAKLGLRAGVVKLFSHGEYFSSQVKLTKPQARSDLNIDSKKHVFLCIGFIQEHKGFDQAIRAFTELQTSSAELYIVGSTRVDVPELVDYSNALQKLADQSPGCHMKHQFVSDYEFDSWIIAADTVLVPYKEIWSSGVLERSKLHNKKIIASDVGGLGDQADTSTVMFTDHDTLVKAMNDDLPINSKSVEQKELMQIDDIESMKLAVKERAHARKTSLSNQTITSFDSMPALKRPEPVSPSKYKSRIKSFVYRLINWQIEPVDKHVTMLQNSTEKAFEELQRRVETIEESSSK